MVNCGDTKIVQHPQVWYQIEALGALILQMATGVWLTRPWMSKRSLNIWVESTESHIAGMIKAEDMKLHMFIVLYIVVLWHA